MEEQCSVIKQVIFRLDDSTMEAERAQEIIDAALEDFVIDEFEKPAVADAQMLLRLYPRIVKKQANELTRHDAQQKRLARELVFGSKKKGPKSSQDFEPDEAA